MNMTFIQALSNEPVAAYVSERIAQQLEGSRKVLWLVSGGSAIAITVSAAQLLAEHDLGNLTLSLIDERYGPPGHKDSNWEKLMAAGLHLPGATLRPVLTGASQSQSANDFQDFLREQFETSDAAIGLLGIGPDGHTSGILPHSPAITAGGLAFAYDGPDYRRITTTTAALAMLDEAVVYAAGAAKWPVLDRLETTLPAAVQPAQVLKSLPKLTIFTDRPQK
jgi:6-phosphogluconolactonase/glucosamine-6-phosphate isomerase/deaminase